MLRRFFEWNRRVCDRIEDWLPPSFTVNFNRVYEAVVRDAMNAQPGQLVLDIGGGKKCFVAGMRLPGAGTRIVAIDIDEGELRQNNDVDARLVGDVTKGLPFRDQTFDIVTSRSLLEHLSDTEAFARHAVRVLRPGGYFIHLCPGKFAPFAMINHVLPNAAARRLLYYFHPSYEQDCGFRAFYDRTYYSAMKGILERSGFEVVEIRRRYYQSIYFNFFVPFYLISLLYDMTARTLGARNLASQLLIVARRRASGTAGSSLKAPAVTL